MLESPVVGHEVVKGLLTRVSERRVPEVVCQSDGMGQVLICADVLGNASGDLRGFERMGEPRPVVVPLVIGKYLGLVFEPAKRLGVYDPVAVPLERCSIVAFLFRVESAAALFRKQCIRGEKGPLSSFLGRAGGNHFVPPTCCGATYGEKCRE